MKIHPLRFVLTLFAFICLGYSSPLLADAGLFGEEILARIGVVEQIPRLIRNNRRGRIWHFAENAQNSLLRRSNHDTDDKNG